MTAFRRLWHVLMLVGLVAFPVTASAWQEDEAGAAGAQASNEPEVRGEISLEVERLGVANRARPGSWCGIRLNLKDQGLEQREVVVRASLTDADGDRPMYERSVATNPGLAQGVEVWLYLRLPPSASMVTISAHEAVERRGGPAAFRAGRLLGRTSAIIRPEQMVDPKTPLVGVVGSRTVGLKSYETSTLNQGDLHLALGHERAHIVPGLDRPMELPDSWQGLSAFETIVWTESSPASLSTARVRALTEWVERGGHLVIVLPSVGQSWLTPGSNPLFDVMPVAGVERVEGVNLEEYRFLLAGREDQFQLPSDAVIHAFLPDGDAGPHEADRIINGPDGRCVVVRRLHGVGAVTLVGIDLTDQRFRFGSYPAADVFWHRVLGRRGMLLSPVELGVGAGRLTPLSRSALVLDTKVISASIARTRGAAAGVMLGFIVFLAYWLVAGPGGVLVLKQMKMPQHSWIFYAGTAALFTVIAWTGATMIRPRQVSASHVSILDHVYGQNTDRARSWVSLLIPRYGDAEVAVEAGDGALGGREAMRNLLAPWEPVDGFGSGAGAFPDARGYTISATNPSRALLPARSTVKQLEVEWAGPPPWDGIRPILQPDPSQAPIYIERVAGTSGRAFLQGVLVHELEVPLEDVHVVFVEGQQRFTEGRLGDGKNPVGRAHVYRRVSPWVAGEGLDLKRMTLDDVQGAETLAEPFFDDLLSDANREAGGVATPVNPSDAPQLLLAASFVSQLEPPARPAPNAVSFREWPAASRVFTHGLDMGRWMTQPCLIVIGFTKDGPSPIPLTVDGERAPSDGLTMVRWVYPLPASPPEIDTGG